MRQVEQQERLLFRPKEAARLLAISDRSLWGSDIPKVRIGRAVRYDIADLKAFIAKRKEPNGAQKETPAAGSTTGARELQDEHIDASRP